MSECSILNDILNDILTDILNDILIDILNAILDDFMYYSYEILNYIERHGG